MSNELSYRLQYHAAFKLRGVYWCAVHQETQLNPDGSCDDCVITLHIIAADMAEAAAMNRAARIQEHDL